jgi:HEAT repeat protein
VKGKFADAIARAALRERALGMLDQAATDPARAELRANALEGLQFTPERLRAVIKGVPAQNVGGGVVGGLEDSIPGVRGVAAMVVGRAKLKEVAEDCRPLLSDPEPLVRIGAIYALKRCGREVDVSPLADFLYDQSPRVRAQAAFVLGEFGEPSAIPMLIEAVRDSNVNGTTSQDRLMELQFAEARAKLGDRDALHEIRAALFPGQSDDLEACALASQIVGELKDRPSIDRLVYLTTMKDDAGQLMPPEIRLAAAGSLAKLGLRQGSFIAAEFASSQQEVQRAQSAYVFGVTGHIANLEHLERMLDDPSQSVRVSAAAAVVRICEGPGR